MKRRLQKDLKDYNRRKRVTEGKKQIKPEKMQKRATAIPACDSCA